MSTICVERMMAAIVRSSAEDFWTLTVIELIQLLRATRIPRVAGVECGVMNYVHNCAAKILNWRIVQAYDVSAAEDFMKVSFLLSAEDGADIAWSQWNMNEPSPSHRLEIPFGMVHTFVEEGFRDNEVIIAFGMEHDATIVKIAVDVHVARLRSGQSNGHVCICLPLLKPIAFKVSYRDCCHFRQRTCCQQSISQISALGRLGMCS
jgi:hypothetical protein